MSVDFYNNSNAEVIWEVLFENSPNFPITKKHFSQLMYDFNESEKHKPVQSLYYLNTTFLKMLHQQQQQALNTTSNTSSNIKLNIQDQILPNYDVKELITVEELHAGRMSQFEKDMSKKQAEFKNMMSTSIPDLPNFEDKKDEPIGSEMEQLIANTMKQRQFDIEQIYSSESTNSIIPSPIQKHSHEPKKQISWANEDTNIEIEPVKSESIFSRLKLEEPTTQMVSLVDDPIMNMLIQINSKLDKLLAI
jgi:hypothetical protein